MESVSGTRTTEEDQGDRITGEAGMGKLTGLAGKCHRYF